MSIFVLFNLELLLIFIKDDWFCLFLPLIIEFFIDNFYSAFKCFLWLFAILIILFSKIELLLKFSDL